MPKYFLSLTIYLVGSFAALFLGYQYDNWIAVIVGFLATAIFATFARKINPNIDKDVSGHVKHGGLYIIIILAGTIVFVSLWVFVFGY